MVANGGLLSEFLSKTNPDRENFPKRNRIIAGLSDAVVVVEAGEKGGALITAEIADSYNRDVLAVPGRVTDSQSAGCNKLIKINKASLLQSADDIAYLMGWDKKPTKQNATQAQLFRDFTSDEMLVINALREKGDLDIDSLLITTGLLPSKAAALLLNMEFEGFIRCLPGKVYRLI
jgi:DNA processing protein